MIKNLSFAWGKNQCILRNYLKEHEQKEYDSYFELFKKTIELVVNPYLKQIHEEEFDLDSLQECKTDDFQGSMVFIIANNYACNQHDFAATYVYYGSCSGCDTLLSISEYEEGRPNEEQVQSYMQLCLNMIQRCKYIWSQCDNEFDVQ